MTSPAKAADKVRVVGWLVRLARDKPGYGYFSTVNRATEVIIHDPLILAHDEAGWLIVPANLLEDVIHRLQRHGAGSVVNLTRMIMDLQAVENDLRAHAKELRNLK